MSYSTGFHWAHQGEGLAHVDKDLYGASGSIQTEATLAAAAADGTIARIPCSNATAIMIMPLLGPPISGSGGTDAKFSLYGVMQQGEPSQPTASAADKFVFQLGVPVAATVTSGDVDNTSSWTLDNPGGFTFQHHDNTAGGQHDMAPFVMAPALSGSDIPTGDNGTLADLETGFTIFPGIDFFSEVILSFDSEALSTSQKFNALISLLY